MDSLIWVCGPTKGRYLEPIPFRESGIRFIGEDGKPIRRPSKHPCEHPNHWKWKKENRLWYSLSKMFYQRWYLTEEEIKEAVAKWDIFSLEMKGRIICEHCARAISKIKKES